MKATVKECYCKPIEINENSILYLFLMIIDVELFSTDYEIVHIPIRIEKKISIYNKERH